MTRLRSKKAETEAAWKSDLWRNAKPGAINVIDIPSYDGVCHAHERKTLADAFYETLKDVFYAEKQSVRALKKSAQAAKAPALKEAFEVHGEESAAQVERLTQVFELIGKPARTKTCEAT